jgi:hypothetical protein
MQWARPSTAFGISTRQFLAPHQKPVRLAMGHLCAQKVNVVERKRTGPGIRAKQ